MANKFLLTGAGFSKSFGGLLSDEVTAYFFNALATEKDIQKSILQKFARKNFEQILSEIRLEHPEKRQIVEKILKDIFIKMSNQMINHHTKPGQTRWMANSVYEFLWQFDCTFTLNQDSFGKKASNGGDKNFVSPRKENRILSNSHNKPYIELHGSYDWEDVFILGSNKKEEIQSRPQLEKYHQFFEKCLNEKNAKLTIIGYNFGDDHINLIIKKAVKAGLSLFIWDPQFSDLNFQIKINDTMDGLMGFLPKNFDLTNDDELEVRRFLER